MNAAFSTSLHAGPTASEDLHTVMQNLRGSQLADSPMHSGRDQPVCLLEGA